jgi:uncharacterized protein YkwD
VSLIRYLLPPTALLATLAFIVLPGRGLAAPEVAEATHYDPLLAPLDRCGGSKQTDTSLLASDQETVMRCMHNYARAKAGRSALASNSLLTSSSDAKTADMLRCGQFSHTACGRRRSTTSSEWATPQAAAGAPARTSPGVAAAGAACARS